jgi:hypothetical protein
MEFAAGLVVQGITAVGGGIVAGAALSFGTVFLARVALRAGASAGTAVADGVCTAAAKIFSRGDKYLVVYRGRTHEITADQYHALTSIEAGWVVVGGEAKKE